MKRKEAGMKEVASSRSRFCPKCGRETAKLVEGLCEECFAARIKAELFRCFRSSQFELKYCKGCDSFFKGKERVDLETAVENFAERMIKRLFGDVKSEIEVSKIEKLREKDKILASLDVNVWVCGVEVGGELPLYVYFRKELCEDCSKIAGGYYAAVVQLRAEGREPSEAEIAKAREIALSSLGEHDFITKEKKVRGGIDFYVSSSAYARRISREIVRRLGGSFSESPKLYGIKNGKRIYRVSFSVRLPPEEEGRERK